MERVAGACLAAWAFLLISRAPELMSAIAGPAFPVRPFLILYPVMLALLLLSGAVLRLPNSKIAVALILLTAWFALSTPFSLWRGGSARWLAFRWMPNMLTFAAFAALALAFQQWRRVAAAIGWATPVIGLAAFQAGRTDWMGRVSVETGTLANANELAALLLMGLPFWVQLVQGARVSMARKLLVYGSLPVLIYLVFRTGSRSGVLALGLLFLMFLLQLRGTARVVTIVAMAAISLAAVVAIPANLRARLGTFLVEKSEAQEAAAVSAAESTQLRKILLLTSIEGALTHPLLGVGPGLFSVYSGYEAEKEGLYYGWREAHNTYAQIASEGGLPALGFFLAALVLSFRSVIRVHRAARRRPDLAELRHHTYAFLMSLAGVSLFALFDSIHHLPILFMMFGLAASLGTAAAPVLQTSPTPPPPGPPPTTPPARFLPAPRSR